MKLFTALLSAIALLPLPAIAMPDPLNLPICYMIKSDGTVVNLNEMCGIKEPVTDQKAIANVANIDEICNSLSLAVYDAPSQFLQDRAIKERDYCLNNKASLQRVFDDLYRK